jgi:3-deoxy-D-manno-octulosonic-acid transferase
LGILYSIGILFYRLFIGIAALVNEKAKLWISGRKAWEQLLELGLAKAEGRKRILFHCASLGEFEQARPVIEDFRRKHTDWFVVVSFFSPSGYEIRRNYKNADFICYLPLDTPSNAHRFASLLQADIAVFVKYEFWYNMLTELKKSGSKLVLIAGRFRKNHIFFKPYGSWFGIQLSLFNSIHVQDEESAKLLKSIGITSTEVSGDPRFDRVAQNAENVEKIDVLEAWLSSRKCVVAGSTWEPDENVLLPWKWDYTLIIAPHEIAEAGLKRIESTAGKKCVRYSELLENSELKSDVLIIDNIGMLMRIYAYASWAWVGGGFGSGLHNILEPAAFGVPVVFGPEHAKFPEADAIIKAGGGFSIRSAYELNELFVDQEQITAAGIAAAGFIETGKGATSKIIQTLDSLC